MSKVPKEKTSLRLYEPMSRVLKRIVGKRNITSFIVLPWIILLASCASNQNYFVLLPDPDGKVGKIEITNKGGTQLLNEAGQAVKVESVNKAPSAPFLMDQKKINELFGEALAAQPEPPLVFVLYFKQGSSDLIEESQKVLPEILKKIKEKKNPDIIIIGHTDRVGPRDLNYKIGLNRAQAFFNQLLFVGIDPKLIEIISHGEDNPLIKTADEVAEPRNRRIEVVIR